MHMYTGDFVAWARQRFIRLLDNQIDHLNLLSGGCSCKDPKQTHLGKNDKFLGTKFEWYNFFRDILVYLNAKGRLISHLELVFITLYTLFLSFCVNLV